MRSVRDVQTALKMRGYDIGVAGADGILGAATRMAVRKFQADQGLNVDGAVGGATLERLFSSGPTQSEAVSLTPWYAEASRLMGQSEIAGTMHNDVILGWANALERRVGGWLSRAFTSDETPWCGLFIAYCIASALPEEPLPANPLGARNWASFGRTLKEPVVGAIAVFWRGERSGWRGHVGFVAGASSDGQHLLIRGGNQDNMVRDAWLRRSRLLDDGLRWPSTASPPNSTHFPVLTIGARPSTNED